MENAAALKNAVLAWLAAVGGVIINGLGGWDPCMKLLVALMVADYVTGVAVAAIWHKSGKTESGALSSVAGFKGLVKKVGIVLMVWIAVLLDNAIGTAYVRTAVVLFFVGNEGISLLENLGLMGVEYPDFIRRALEALRDEGNNGSSGNKSAEGNMPGKEQDK